MPVHSETPKQHLQHKTGSRLSLNCSIFEQLIRRVSEDKRLKCSHNAASELSDAVMWMLPKTAFRKLLQDPLSSQSITTTQLANKTNKRLSDGVMVLIATETVYL